MAEHADLPEVPEATGGGTATVTEDDVREAMKDVVDPEALRDQRRRPRPGLRAAHRRGPQPGHRHDADFRGLPAHRRDPGPDQHRVGRPGQRRRDQLGLDAAVGPRQDLRRRPRAAARSRLQCLITRQFKRSGPSARFHAKLNVAPTYFGPTTLEVVPPPAWSFGANEEQADALLAPGPRRHQDRDRRGALGL